MERPCCSPAVRRQARLSALTLQTDSRSRQQRMHWTRIGERRI
jgi:hypothetical protein